MKIAYALALLLLPTSCGSAPYPHDPLLEGYLRQWNAEFKRDFDVVLVIDSTKIKPGHDGNVILADCLIDEDKPPVITVYTKTWGKETDLKKEAVLYHEFGHCDLHLDHDIRVGSDLCPVSLMYPLIPPKDCYSKHRSDYMDLLRKAM